MTVWYIVASVALVLSSALPSAAQHPFLLRPVPRFLDEADRALLLYEANQSASVAPIVRVSIEVDPVTSRRWLRVITDGRPTPSKATILCDGDTRDLSLTQAFTQSQVRLGVYAVGEALENWLLTSTTCSLGGLDVTIALPLDMIQASWRGHTPITPSMRLSAMIEQIFGPADFSVRIGPRVERVRCLGIEVASTSRTPRIPGGPTRTEPAPGIELIKGGTLMLEFDVLERAQEGHLLAYVYVEGKLLNAELLRAGVARAAISAPNVLHRDLFLRLEREARAARRGIWSAGSAIPAASQAPPVMAVAHTLP